MLRRSLALAFAAGLLVPATAAAAPDARDGRAQTEPRPPSFYVVRGHGWGHGVGMSQYGALGFAQHGFAYTRILAQYYRGTTLGPASLRRVRVLLADKRPRLTVSSPVGFRVVDGDGASHTLAAGKYSFGPTFALRVDVATKPVPLPGPLTFIPSAGQPLALDGRWYRGQLRVLATPAKLQAVNVVALEQYLYGVVPAEMPSAWPAEALKAQAVAARSYALAHLAGRGAFDLYADTRSQVYRGVVGEKPETNAAVDATARQVLLYAGRPANAVFHSTSGGRTLSAADAWGEAVPYLVSVPDPYDSVSPYHDWGPFRFTARRLAQALKPAGLLLDVRTTRNASGRVAAVVAVGATGEVTVPATALRTALGLRSTWFDVGVLSLEPPEPAAPLAYGARGVLTGIARDVEAPVLQQRPATARSWMPLGSVAPEKDGRFAVAVKPATTTRYRLAAGTVAANEVRIRVAALVRLHPARRATSLSGLVRPVVPGATVQVQRLRGSTWTTVAKAVVDERGEFAAALELVPGDYRARFAPGRGLVTGVSRVLRVFGE